MGRTIRAHARSRSIRIVGAQQNNLKNLNLDVPLNAMTVITGVSGSGKSSLAFDTLYAEGQRLYVETFSAYTRQFLDRMDKPAVDRIEGIPPAVAIDQTNPVRTSRSTVGTMTEINDHLKLLFARGARLFCSGCGKQVRRDSAESVANAMATGGDIADRRPASERRVAITFPVQVGTKVGEEDLDALVKSQGYRGVFRRDGSTAYIIQDRVTLPGQGRERLVESIEAAFAHGHGRVTLWDANPGATERWSFSTDLHCADCDIHYRDPVPNMFSFNSPLGACDACRGFGRVIGIDYGLVIPDQTKSLLDGAIRPWQSKSYEECQRDLLRFARKRGIRVDVPWSDLSDDEQRWVIDGEGEWDDDHWYGTRRFFDWLEGRSYKMHIRVLLSRYRAYRECEECAGARLKPESLRWRVGPGQGLTIHQIMLQPIVSLVEFFDHDEFNEADDAVASVVVEIRRRLSYLKEVGLGYLNLDRQSRTLSGGEVQRVNLTTALGTALVNTLFVLDEPSIGLHPRDVGRMVAVLHRLRDSGNTIVVVEHDPAVIREADHVIDLGPGAGTAGGHIIFEGTPAELARDAESITGGYLGGRRSVADDAGYPRIGLPKAPGESSAGAGSAGRRAGAERDADAIVIRGASEHNLKRIDVRIPLHRIVALTGVSGSGKSTLMEQILHRAALRYLGSPTEEPGRHDGIEGLDLIDEVVLVDQSSIGKSARSNPASYVGAFDAIRSVYAALEDAREGGFTAGSFSFNSARGQCPTCKGSGFEHVEMQFLSDVYLRCPDCDGRRFRSEVLEVRLTVPDGRRLSIADLLDLTVDEALVQLAAYPRVTRALAPLADVGLGYLTLGQPVPTLSGGEAQRLKLAGHLAVGGTRSSHALFLFDEPTTGLHFSDIARLLSAFARLREAGHSLVIIEHNLDVIGACDWVIDLGPEGGDGGGEIVFEGNPADLVGSAAGSTARELAAAWSRRAVDGTVGTAGDNGAGDAAAEPMRGYLDTIEVRGAREHNLRNIDVSIPHNALTVLTGVSGSGKSTVAFDIVFAEGQRRYLESLNAYARQFVQPAARADVDGAAGIPPTVAIEQRTSRGGRKSTVATATEISQFMRLLYARLGTQFCPDCVVPIEPQSERTILESIKAAHKGTRVTVLAPLVMGRKGYYTELAEWARRKGFGELRVDGEMVATDAWPRLDRYHEHTIELAFGPFDPGARRSTRHADELSHAVNQALHHGHGVLYVTDAAGRQVPYSTTNSCPQCGRSFTELDPRLFSFNSKHGWCPDCMGTGIALTRAERDLPPEEIGWDTDEHRATCRACSGRRLRTEALAVRFRDRSIAQTLSLTIADARRFLGDLSLGGREEQIARDIIPEMRNRLEFLEDVGLGYLSLDRAAPTLSGGEAQRIRLAAQLGSNLQGVCYVLDEPTIGLHPRDNQMLLGVLRRLTDKGNTVVVVEHDEETIRAADHVVDLGPGGGVRGGRVIAVGTPAQIARNRESITGEYLRKRRRRSDATKGGARPSNDGAAGRRLRLSGARLHNLKEIDVEIPLGGLVGVTGVSGSGKSTLVRDVLYRSVAAAIEARRGRGRRRPAPVGCKRIEGADDIERILEVDQTPIGKTPRSTPATYVGIWDEIRALYASIPESKMRGYTAGRFSFNTADGRCEACKGQGTQRIEMSFLPDVVVVCDECGGSRFTPETLAIRFKEKSISDVLALDVETAAAFFHAQPKIRHTLELLVEVGLGYLTLGQQSPTLSGGEAQRIKLVAELARSSTTTESLSLQRTGIGGNRAAPRALYVLDEPTVGLHAADVARLIEVLARLVATGATVIVIEHNLEVIAATDWVVDLGPEGGDGGGYIVAAGTPRTIARCDASHTGAFLRQMGL